MKKYYEEPSVEIEKFNTNTFVTTSTQDDYDDDDDF